MDHSISQREMDPWETMVASVKFHDAVVSWPRSPGFFWLTFKRLKKKRAVRAGNGKEGGFLNHAVHH